MTFLYFPIIPLYFFYGIYSRFGGTVTDISVLIPSIRTVNWQQVKNTLKQSCQRYSYEIVFSGPFDPPAGFDMTGIKFVKTYACPSVAAQLGLRICEGRLVYHAVDDSRYAINAVDLATDLYNKVCGRKDVINMRYTEADEYTGKEFPLDFWYAHYHPPMRLPGIPSHYKIALHFLVDRNYFMELGGFDCSYEYLNFNLHDLQFRIQYDNGKIHDSPTDVAICNHYGNRRIDHAAIEDAYPNDHAIFSRKYNNPNALRDNPVRIDFNNWRNQPDVWQRRFAQKKFTSYEEMISS